MTDEVYQLKPVVSAADWRTFHRLRRVALFEARGRFGHYRDDHPDDRMVDNQPLLLIHAGVAVGSLRLDRLDRRRFVLRTVVVDAARQRRGHGGRLLALAEGHAVQQGARQLLVNAAPDAVGFYDCAGFRPGAWRDPLGASGKSVQMIKAVGPDDSKT